MSSQTTSESNLDVLDTNSSGLTIETQDNMKTSLNPGAESKEEWTSLFKQVKPTPAHGFFVIFMCFFIVGSVQGYCSSLILIVQSKGATFEDQSFFTLIYYPYLFKLLFAPVIDSVSLKCRDLI